MVSVGGILGYLMNNLLDAMKHWETWGWG